MTHTTKLWKHSFVICCSGDVVYTLRMKNDWMWWRRQCGDVNRGCNGERCRKLWMDVIACRQLLAGLLLFAGGCVCVLALALEAGVRQKSEMMEAVSCLTSRLFPVFHPHLEKKQGRFEEAAQMQPSPLAVWKARQGLPLTTVARRLERVTSYISVCWASTHRKNEIAQHAGPVCRYIWIIWRNVSFSYTVILLVSEYKSDACHKKYTYALMAIAFKHHSHKLTT